MRRGTLLMALLLALAILFVVRWRWAGEKGPEHKPKDIARVEPAPLTPWRNPAPDLAALFPSATNYVIESRILSGLTAPIQQQLGRLMHPDENPLRIHRVLQGDRALGAILLTRVKGEHGGIEIVTGVQTNGRLRGVLIQSQREPPAVAAAITNAAWLAGFAGQTGETFRVGIDLPEVPESARVSAQAIADGVRDQLIVFRFAETPLQAGHSKAASHH
jgi:hypothetical protein